MALICLDHDLGANLIVNGDYQDPGTGRDVADYLSGEEACCPVLIHSSNAMAAPGMMMVLEDGVGFVHEYRHTMIWNESTRHGFLNLSDVCKRRHKK